MRINHERKERSGLRVMLQMIIIKIPVPTTHAGNGRRKNMLEVQSNDGLIRAFV